MSEAQLERAAYLERLRPTLDLYTPRGRVAREAKKRRVAIISGATAIGKGVIFEDLATHENDAPEYAHVGSRVSRRKRNRGDAKRRRDRHDTGYEHFYDIDRPSVRRDLAKAVLGRVFVQASSHIETGEVYATGIRSYPKNILAVLETTYLEADWLHRSERFGELLSIYITPDDPKQWWNHWGERDRDRISVEERINRMRESRQSAELCLSGELPTSFVITRYDHTAYLDVARAMNGTLDEEENDLGRVKTAEFISYLDTKISELELAA